MTSDDLGFTHRYEQGENATTLLLLHGTGGDENDLIPLARRLLPGAGLLSPRGKVLEQGMPRFFRRLDIGVFDVEDLKARAEELAGFVTAAAEVYGFDRRRTYVLGYSNGANIAAGMFLLRPEVVAGGALLHVMLPFEPDRTPSLAGTEVLLTSGRQDPYAPAEQTERLADILRTAGAEVSVEWGPGGHEITGAELDAVQRWLIARAAS